MPAKKGGNTDIGGTSNARGEHASISPPLSESSDPVVQAVGIVDRKVRNLEKRKVSRACRLSCALLMLSSLGQARVLAAAQK